MIDGPALAVFEHDFLGKPLFTFPDHAVSPASTRISPGSTDRPTRSPALIGVEFGTSTIMGFPATPPIAARWRSPTKLTLSTSPVRAAPSGAMMRIDSGRIIAK